MANHKSAKKRIRQNAVRRMRNRYRLSSTRTAIKAFREISEKETASGMLPAVFSLVDKCVKSSIYHKNKGANIKGKLAKFVNGLS